MKRRRRKSGMLSKTTHVFSSSFPSTESHETIIRWVESHDCKSTQISCAFWNSIEDAIWIAGPSEMSRIVQVDLPLIWFENTGKKIMKKWEEEFFLYWESLLINSTHCMSSYASSTLTYGCEFVGKVHTWIWVLPKITLIRSTKPYFQTPKNL